MARGLRKKELKQPDEFVSFWTHLAGAVLAHRKEAVVGGVALVVVMGGLLLGSAWREHRAAGASRDFERIQKIAIAELLPADGAAASAERGVPRFKTDRERREAAVKEADSFLGAHGGSALAPAATLLKAGFLLDLGKPDEAIALYEKVLSGGIAKDLRVLPLEGIGYAHEAKGELDKAAQDFARLEAEASTGTGFYRDRALFHEARIAARQGNAKRAADLYKQIIEKSPNTSLRDEISDRLAVLEAH